jgi:internalin A
MGILNIVLWALGGTITVVTVILFFADKKIAWKIKILALIIGLIFIGVGFISYGVGEPRAPDAVATFAETQASSPADDGKITWDDPVFGQMVADVLDKKDDEIEAKDLEEITELAIYGNEDKFSSYATPTKNVEEGALAYTDLNCYEPRNHNDHPESFFIDGNVDDQGRIIYYDVGNITSLTDLRHFTSLQRLTICFNEVKALPDLSGLKSLKYLNLFGCWVADVNGLADCEALESLNLSLTAVINLNPLAELTNLRVLDLSHNNFSDTPLEPLKKLTDLENLSIEHAWLAGDDVLAPLEELAKAQTGMSKLHELKLRRNEITNIDPLFGFTNLTHLDLSSNEITELMPLYKMTGLEHLDLHENQITNIIPLAYMTNLTYLDLYFNKITDLLPLYKMTKLNHLNLGGNEIADISLLAGMANLTYLDLDGNKISNLQPLSDMTGLKHLGVGYNEITDFSPLANMTKLEYLSLGGDGYEIWDVGLLKNMGALNTLYLGNLTGDMAEVLMQLPKLHTVWCSNMNEDVDIEAMENAGITIDRLG